MSGKDEDGQGTSWGANLDCLKIPSSLLHSFVVEFRVIALLVKNVN
jgi:hypothetical protein